MSNWPKYVAEQSPYSGSMRLVHFALAVHADNDTGVCWPSQQTLANEARVSLSSVERAVKRMCDDGYLVRFKKGRKTYYRLLVSNGDPSPMTGETRHPRRVTPSTHDGSDPSPMTGAYRTTSELPRELSEEPTTPGLRPGGGTMKPVGDLDGDAEMLDLNEPRKPKPKAGFAKAPTEGTHGWVVYRFERERMRAQVGTHRYNHGHLDRLLKSLRDDDGMTNREIEVLVRTFFVKHGPEIRTKVREIDLVSLFAQMVPQLQYQAKEKITNVRTGRETAMDRATAQVDSLRKKAGE